MAEILPDVRKAVEAFLGLASRDFHIDRAWLFGSRAHGGDPWSDVDLALMSSSFRGQPWLELHQRLWGYKVGAAVVVEPVAFTPEQVAAATPADFIGGVILREGVVVYENGQLVWED